MRQGKNIVSVQEIMICIYLSTMSVLNVYVLTSLSVQFSSVAQSCPTLCNPMNHSTPGLPVHHQLLEFTQTHVPLPGMSLLPPPAP